MILVSIPGPRQLHGLADYVCPTAMPWITIACFCDKQQRAMCTSAGDGKEHARLQHLTYISPDDDDDDDDTDD